MTEPNNTHDNNRPLKISLESFYADILSKKFTTSVEAIDYCRQLCARFGFTIKQEQSTYRNIYVYCSREGFPDSLRNPKSNPKRRRPSKRCDCRWRIVLNEQNEVWHFRKSLNPDASKHNHDLMRPDEIDKGWPKEMLDLICELARQRLPTPDIRTRVQLLYAHIPWNERRFYNRLSEERTKQRIRDAESRVQQLTAQWSNVVTAAAASQELTEVALVDLRRMVDKLCGMTQTDSSTFPLPHIQRQDGYEGEDTDCDSTDEHDEVATSQEPLETSGDSSQEESTKPSTSRKGNKTTSQPDTPKGYTPVTVPQQVYYVKLHPHRVLQDVQQLHRRRSRSLAFSDDFNAPTEDPTVFNNQLKKQKTPMLMEMAQPQLPPPPPDMHSARHYDPQQQFPPSINDPMPSGLMYPPRDGNYYSSTSYPVYQQQTLMPPPPPPSRYMVDTNRPNMPLYSTGRPPLLTVTPDFQPQQPMTPTPPSSTSSSSPGRMAPQPNISMLSTSNATTPSPKDTDTTPSLQQPPFYEQRLNQSPSSAPFYRPPPPSGAYPPLQQPQQDQQRIYYSHLPPQVLPVDNNSTSTQQPPTMYYVKQPHLPP